MNPPDTLTMLFRHNLWANLRLLEQCATLTDEQLATAGVGAFGAVHATLQHIATSERSYFTRISTGQPYPRTEGAPTLTLVEIRELLQMTGNGLIEWAVKVTPTETVVIDWDGTPRNVPKTIILTQALNHSAEHRSQILTILTALGLVSVDLQGWAYFEALEGLA